MLLIGIWMIVDTGIYLVAWLAYLTDGWSLLMHGKRPGTVLWLGFLYLDYSCFLLLRNVMKLIMQMRSMSVIAAKNSLVTLTLSQTFWEANANETTFIVFLGLTLRITHKRLFRKVGYSSTDEDQYYFYIPMPV